MLFYRALLRKRLPHGLVVRIPGSHPGGPGSIPGVGKFFFLVALRYQVFNISFLNLMYHNLTWYLLKINIKNTSYATVFFRRHTFLKSKCLSYQRLRKKKCLSLHYDIFKMYNRSPCFIKFGRLTEFIHLWIITG